MIKLKFTISVFIVLISFALNAQIEGSKYPAVKESAINGGINVIPAQLNSQDPYYVIIADGKQLEVSADKMKEKYDGLSILNPDHIKEISVYKDEKASELYGDNGKNGVIIITLKKGKLKLLPDEFKSGFKVIE
ncbi:MAG: hypothetical protein HKN67_08590 [Saprospiraceae bacterium]|nr:hypothetical protein [Bacteroidia bacterium]NNF21986.1 hypothetical protein [Saprospiraceae bacterium]